MDSLSMDSVETDRFLLRPFTLDDGLALHTVVGEDPDMTWDATSRSLERTQQTLRERIEHYKQHGFGVWAVIDKENGELIGQTGLQVADNHTDVELVAYTAKRRWRTGVGYEACVGALAYGFTSLRLPRIVAVTRINNVGGQHLASTLGFRLVGEGKAYGDDVYLYEMKSEGFLLGDRYFRVVHGNDAGGGRA